MTFSKLHKTALASASLCLGLTTGLDILHTPSAQALNSQQITQAANAMRYIRNKGCSVTPQASAFQISCSTKVVAAMVQPELDASELKLYNRSGKSYARFKVGRNGTNQTTRISNIRVNPPGPLNLKIMPDNINSKKIELRGTRNGFQFITSFESAGAEFQVEDKYFGRWCDSCFPDVHWNNGKIGANLNLTRNLRLNTSSQAIMRGEWMLRGNLDVIPDDRVNNSIASEVSTLLQNNVGRINTLITNQLTRLGQRLPNHMANQMSYNFANGTINVVVPVR